MRGIKQGMGSFGLGVLIAITVGLLLPAMSQSSPDMNGAPVGQSDTVAAPSSSTETSQAEKPTPYIVGGSETTFSSHPWLVQITLNGQAFCGGALVHPRLVLTAAHCLWDDQNKVYWYQEANMQAFTSRSISQTGGEELQLKGVWVADNYQPLNPGSGENDWALISLASSTSRPTLKIAGSNEKPLWKPGRQAIVAGFGNIQSGGPASTTLKQVGLPILSDSVCGSVFGAQFRLSSMLCAGVMEGGAGSCQGDSGGPLTVGMDGGGRRIVGVVSFGENCGAPNKPTIYTRVASAELSGQINAAAAQMGQIDGFPGLEADTNLLGSGAKPVGCAAAKSAAAKAKAKASRLAKKARKAKAKVRKTRGKAKKRARKGANKAQKASNKAKQASRKAQAKAKATCN